MKSFLSQQAETMLLLGAFFCLILVPLLIIIAIFGVLVLTHTRNVNALKTSMDRCPACGNKADYQPLLFWRVECNSCQAEFRTNRSPGGIDLLTLVRDGSSAKLNDHVGAVLKVEEWNELTTDRDAEDYD